MRWIAVGMLLGLLIIGATASAQNSRAVIKGTVWESTGTVFPNPAVSGVNSGTGVHYQCATDSAGNYVFANLPPGKYEISVSASGFKPYVRKDLIVSGAQIVGLDVVIEKENSDEAVEGPPPQRLDGQQMHAIRGETLNNTPLLGFSTGEGRIRNPLYALQLTPGSLMTPLEYFRINGAPSNTESLRIDGQDVNNGFRLSNTVQNQVGVDAVE